MRKEAGRVRLNQSLKTSRAHKASVKKSPSKRRQVGAACRKELRQTCRRPIRVVVDTARYKIRRHFPLLAGSYEESSLATELANIVAELLRSVVENKVEEIKRRKGLSINEVQTDAEIIALLNQRDSEGRRLSAALRKALFVRKKQASERASLEAEVRAAVNSIRGITYDRLAKILNRHSANALRMEMRRNGLSIKDFKKTNK